MSGIDASRTPVLAVCNLHKTFYTGFFRKKVEAVRGIDFEVRPGEIFGFLGPNGAGKTTTLKMVLQLIYPTRGSVKLFGRSADETALRRRLGYLPENPYIYQYLTPLEFLDLCGRLTGLDQSTRRRRTRDLIERVGLGHAADRPIRKFSKGMMQRAGLAQALLHAPEFLILDEPMSGLDPIGRKEVRDILLEERQRGTTLLITSHILADIERLCDRVAIVNHGQLTAYGALKDLLRPEVRRVEIELTHVSPALEEALRQAGHTLARLEQHVVIVVEGDDGVMGVIERVGRGGGRVVAVTPQRETLEDLFVRKALARVA